MARYKNGWINEADVKAELTGYGMSAERVEELWQTKFKAPAGAERVESTKQLTRALIIKGAKQGQIDRTETIELLQGINYDLPEAEFIYAVEVEGAASPEIYSDYHKLVNDYRRSLGMSAHELTEAAIAAEKAYLDAGKRLAEAKQKEAPQAEILSLEALVAEQKIRFETALKLSQET